MIYPGRRGPRALSAVGGGHGRGSRGHGGGVRLCRTPWRVWQEARDAWRAAPRGGGTTRRSEGPSAVGPSVAAAGPGQCRASGGGRVQGGGVPCRDRHRELLAV